MDRTAAIMNNIMPLLDDKHDQLDDDDDRMTRLSSITRYQPGSLATIVAAGMSALCPQVQDTATVAPCARSSTRAAYKGAVYRSWSDMKSVNLVGRDLAPKHVDERLRVPDIQEVPERRLALPCPVEAMAGVVVPTSRRLGRSRRTRCRVKTTGIPEFWESGSDRSLDLALST
jgi:hypothetical protein